MDQKTLNKVRVAGIVVNWIEELAPKMYPYVEFIKNEDESEGKYRIAELKGEGLEIHEIMQRKYLKWYDCVLEMLQEYYPEKVEEFTAAYENILPYVTLDHKPKLANSCKMQFEFFKYLTAQKTILSHLFARMSTMEITESEPEDNKIIDIESAPAEVPPEMKGAIFEQAIKPVLDEEIRKIMDILTHDERTTTEIEDLLGEMASCDPSDVETVNSGYESLKNLCKDNEFCKENIKKLEPIFNIISRL
ncbi:hypothetical protein [Methanococcoides sp. FTZ1]|uniref:hypothetical protein n=1 Tax=Methanococcoides sp. FTZ1 TaxID=3439061 RepID=UPI003F86705F